MVTLQQASRDRSDASAETLCKADDSKNLHAELKVR